MIFIEKTICFIFNKLILIVWDSIWFWRISFIISFIIILILIKYKYHILFKKSIIKHDLNIFHQINDFFSERKISDFLNKLDYQVINCEDIDFIKSFHGFFEETGNQYLIKSIRKCLLELSNSLNKLLDFISNHFMTHNRRPHDERLHFEPDLKYGDQSNEKEILYKELIKLIKNTEESYKRR